MSRGAPPPRSHQNQFLTGITGEIPIANYQPSIAVTLRHGRNIGAGVLLNRYTAGQRNDIRTSQPLIVVTSDVIQKGVSKDVALVQDLVQAVPSTIIHAGMILGLP